jgi:glycosyltransferase involved in cell wall biosynthesis
MTSEAGAGDRDPLRGVCLLVTDIDAPSGGVQKNSRLLLKELRQRGIATYACVRNYHGFPTNGLIDGTVVHRSRVFGRHLALNGVLYFLETFWWLLRHRRQYDVIHCQQMFGPTMVAAAASFFVPKPILTRVTTVGELGEVKQVREMPLSALRLLLIRRVNRWAALTGAMKSELVGLGIPERNISIIPNSTDIPAQWAGSPGTKARLREELGLADEKIGVFVGRLSEEKNLDLLIEAWANVVRQFAGAQLLILGAGGAYRNVEYTLRNLVAELHLADNVRFLGHIDGAEDFVMASDVFVLPSRTEGMSNALVEALACGAAIVATDIPGNSEICTDGENALLVPVGDRAALVDAITTILSSPSLAERLGKAARRKAEQELSLERMVSVYLRTYCDLALPTT